MPPDNTENVKFKQLRIRINSILLQLSGLTPPTQDRMSLLQSLFREFRHELTKKEEEDVLNLFTLAFMKENMSPQRIGYMSNKLEYHPSETHMNTIETELRRLLGVHCFYDITKENKDYQVGEY